MTKHKLCKIWGVVFLSICIYVCMLGGFVGMFETIDNSQEYFIADAATTVESYYASLEDDLNKTGTAFRSELAYLITTTQKKNTSYDELKTVYKTSDADPNKSGNIIWFYTGTSISYNGTLGSGSGATNREHVWPKNGGDAFPKESEAGSDAHHLRPAEATLNSTRSDNSFGEVPTTNNNIVKEAGRTDYPSTCYQANSTFYPGEGYRGATARILMYVQTRWGDDYNLKFVLGNGNNKTIGDIEDLMKWHLLEPPTEAEKARNEVVFGIQGNRNPFIDHPEYAEMIYCHDGQSYNDELQAVVAQYGSYLDSVTDPNVDAESITLSSTQNTLIVGESVNLTASVNPSNASKEVTWTSSNPTVASVENGRITALSAGTTTITATSVKTPSVKATATINVKALSAINITGTATKTAYTAGESFNPAGLIVTATYSDLSTAVIPNAQVQWLDGTTRATTLSMGTTTIIAKYGSIEKTITGITVAKSTTQSISITRNSFSTSGTTYGWNNWSAGGISGQAYMYPGNKNTIQMNNGKTAYFLFSNTALPGELVSVTVKTTDTSGNTSVSKTWEVRTSNSAFSQASGKTSAGTSRGTITSSAEGGTLTLNTSDKYFAINYTGSGATYISEIIIVYKAGSDDTCNHISSDWIVDEESTCNVQGSQHKECTLCGETLDSESLPLAEHKYVAGTPVAPTCTTEGYTLHTCSVCSNSVKKDIKPALTHSFGNWTSNGNGTHTRVCSNDASHKETNNCSGGVATCEDAGKCTACNAEYISAKGHKYPENWTDNGENHIKVCENDSNHVETESHSYTNACDNDCNVCGATRVTAGHSYDNECDATCNICGAGRNVTHTDENPCDNKCDNCGADIIPPCAEHTYTDECDDMCNVCSFVRDDVPHKFASDCDTICHCGESRITTTSHTWTNACDAECDLCSATRTPADHVYDNGCDTTCNVCGATRTTAGHVDLSPSDEVCDNCGESMHTHNHTSVTTAPTCENGGYTTYTCSCGNTYQADQTPAIGHSFSDWTPDGKGKETRTCSVCNKSEERTDANFDGAKAFKDAVEAVKNAKTLEEKFTAIKIALAEYKNVPEENKYSPSCTSAYTELMSEIASYNSVVNQINLDSQTATNDAIKLFAGAFSILAFAAYLLLNAFRRA